MSSQTRTYSPALVSSLGVAAVLLFAVLYQVDNRAYQRLLQIWMLHPFPHPFIDWQFVPDAAECWARGVNVYIATPCYALAPTMPHPYSPLWLRFSFLPTSDQAVAVFGVGWALLFWAVQAYLPAPKTGWQLTITLLVAFSSLIAFALERANVDLIIFLLAVSGIALWLGPLPLRLVAYAVFLFAGMLKFYPLVLLILVLRERPRVFFSVAAIAALILAAAVLNVRDELVAVSHNIPKGSYFTDLFGSVNLPFGMPTLLAYVAQKLEGAPPGASSFGWVTAPLYLAMLVSAVIIAWWLTVRAGLQEAVDALPSRHHALLVAGAVLLCGCFFAGQSVGYRGIFLLLTLPGLFELRRSLPPVASACVTVTLFSFVFVAWVLTLEYASVQLRLTRGYPLDTDGYGLAHWLVHELAWWWIIAVLLSTILSFVVSSTVGAWVMSGLARSASIPRPASP